MIREIGRRICLGKLRDRSHLSGSPLRLVRLYSSGNTDQQLVGQMKPINLDDQEMILHKTTNTNLTMLEGDIESFIKKISKKCTGDMKEFLDNRKKFGMVSQLLYDEQGSNSVEPQRALDDIKGLYNPNSVIEFDFSLLKPIQILDQKLRPRKNQLLIESAVHQTRSLLALMMEAAGGLKATRQYQVHDLTGEIFSYRLFQAQRFYEGSPEVSGHLFKQLYPPKQERPQSTEDDEFMDLIVHNPRSSKLWINVYSPDPELWDAMSIKKAENYEFDLTRWIASLPEFEECEGATLETCNLYRLGLLKKTADQALKQAIVSKKRKLAALGKLTSGLEIDNGTKIKIGLFLDNPSDIHGETVGFYMEGFDPNQKVDSKLVIENSDGSRPLRIIKSAGNAVLLEVSNTFLQRRLEVQGKYLHIYDVNGIWEDEQRQQDEYSSSANKQ